tara:strand:+ start:8701 stop:9279 length:579 start_codon:yes stop_codon:yes gene_type:complete
MEIKSLTSNKGNILDGAFVLKPSIFKDSRGFFYESWNQKVFDNLVGEKIIFSQDNHSSSNLGVLRGLHYQIEPCPQGKLVRCINGSIFDVAVDIRSNSPTFGEWVSIILDKENKFMFWIPVGYAHGFLTLEDKSEVIYKASGHWSKEHDRSIKWDDKKINIKWPLGKIKNLMPIISQKDSIAPNLDNADTFK